MSNKTLKAFNIYQKIHFIGIGGIGISALARIFKRNGHTISGTDQNSSHNTDLLISEGINVQFGHEEKFLPKECDLVIYTRAITANNPELLAARNRTIKTLSYPEAIGELTKSYDTFCICGTHGKTTTTAMIGKILLDSGIDPTVIVGSIVKDFDNKNELLGDTNTLILESCEYQESFLHYFPKTIILNNIESEHLDYFKNEQNYVEAFKKFLQKLPSDGLLIANGDDTNIQKIIQSNNFDFRIVTFGRNESNNFVLNDDMLKTPQKENHNLDINLPGKHNLMNAAAAFITALSFNIQPNRILKGLKAFSGTCRRFEIKGVIGSLTIVDDYGHAPTEIRATLNAAKERFGANSKILCIFQPHQYSRTFQFLDEFSDSFKLADKVFIPNIYRSRDSDEDVARINVDKLVDTINAKYPKLAENTVNFATTVNKTMDISKDFDVIITIGAGNVTELSDELVLRLQNLSL